MWLKFPLKSTRNLEKSTIVYFDAQYKIYEMQESNVHDTCIWIHETQI